MIKEHILYHFSLLEFTVTWFMAPWYHLSWWMYHVHVKRMYIWQELSVVVSKYIRSRFFRSSTSLLIFLCSSVSCIMILVQNIGNDLNAHPNGPVRINYGILMQRSTRQHSLKIMRGLVDHYAALKRNER